MARATVLMVEDDPEIGPVYAELLSLSDYEVKLTTTAADALFELAAGTPIDILFSDVRLGDGPNGLWLAEQALKLRPTLVIVLTTAYSSAFSEVANKPYQLLLKPYKCSQQIVDLLEKSLCERDQRIEGDL